MLDPTQVPVPPPRGRAVLWTLVPIALGVLVLLGGAVAGGVYAWRHRATGGAVASAPSAVAPLPLPLPAPLPTGLLPPSTPSSGDDDDQSGASDDDDVPNDAPVAPVALPPSATGARFHRLESTALLPVTEGQTIWGDANALVTVTLFGDLECLHTRAALGGMARLATRFGERLRLVFRHRPLTSQPSAEAAGRAIAAVTQQRGADVAWQVLTRAASSREPASSGELGRWLSSAGISGDPGQFSSDPAAGAQLERDAVLGALLSVRATPTWFVNGRRVIGEHSDGALVRVVEDEMRAVRWMRAQRVPAEEIYVRRVKANLIGVANGATSRACIPVETAPSVGAVPALVTVIEFSNYECPYTRDLEPVLARVMARYPGRVRRVWRSFVLPQQERASRIAAFALAVRGLGGEPAFWAIHAALMRVEPAELDDTRLVALAKQLGLDGTRLLLAASDPELARKLAVDQELSRDLELRGTPTLFVNGRELRGAVAFPALDAIIRDELSQAQRIVKAGTPPDRLERVLCE